MHKPWYRFQLQSVYHICNSVPKLQTLGVYMWYVNRSVGRSGVGDYTWIERSSFWGSIEEPLLAEKAHHEWHYDQQERAVLDVGLLWSANLITTKGTIPYGANTQYEQTTSSRLQPRTYYVLETNVLFVSSVKSRLECCDLHSTALPAVEKESFWLLRNGVSWRCGLRSSRRCRLLFW